MAALPTLIKPLDEILSEPPERQMHSLIAIAYSNRELIIEMNDKIDRCLTVEKGLTFKEKIAITVTIIFGVALSIGSYFK